MTGAGTRNSKVVKARREAVYRAFLDPSALAVWLPPDDMSGHVHSFDAKHSGGYRMSLTYPASEQVFRGKTSERTDTVVVRFMELTPFERIVQAVRFESADPAFAGEMTMIATFTDVDGGTEVAIACHNIPSGVRPEDNAAGCASSLEKLADWLNGASGDHDPGA